MALPVIQVDSASGSDTQASGAGPSTALFGTTDASTDGAGTVVTLTAGTDLTNVATDGSHVIFLNDTTAGKRNFGKITAKAGSGGATPTVTVSDAFDTSISGKSWAIGGKRASIGATTSSKLFNNNSAAGDAMPGWIIRLMSGHGEDVTSSISFRRSGDATSGSIILEGEANAGTLPYVRLTTGNDLFIIHDAVIGIVCQRFEVRETSGPNQLFLVGSSTTGGSFALLKGIKADGVTCTVGVVAYNYAFVAGEIIDSFMYNDHATGACVGSASTYVGTYFKVANCYMRGAKGISLSVYYGSSCIEHNIFDRCGTGIDIDFVGSAYGSFSGNTFYNTTGDGLNFQTNIAHDAAYPYRSLRIENNIFDTIGGHGIDFQSGQTDAKFPTATVIRGNTFHTITGNSINPSTITISTDGQTADPQFTNAAGLDFSIGTNLKAKGVPVGGSQKVGVYSSTYSYVEPGAAQRQEVGGGGGLGNRIISASGGLIMAGHA